MSVEGFFIKKRNICLIFAAPEYIVRDVAQPGSALAWGARGRKFESCRPDTDWQNLRNSGGFVVFKRNCGVFHPSSPRREYRRICPAAGNCSGKLTHSRVF
jgi:hypothetical protein